MALVGAFRLQQMNCKMPMRSDPLTPPPIAQNAAALL